MIAGAEKAPDAVRVFTGSAVWMSMLHRFDRESAAEARFDPEGVRCTEPGKTLPQAGAAQRIMILMHDFSGGGTEHVALRLANAWAALGRDVAIFCGSEVGPTRALLGRHVHLERAQPEIIRSATSRLRLGKAASVYAAHFRPDIVFAPGNYHLPVLASFAHFDATGATTIGKISNPLVRSGWGALRRSLHGWQIARLTAKIDCLIAMSPALRADTQRLLPRSRIEMCWEPIFGPGDGAPLDGRKDGIPSILSVGRLEKQKNFGLALTAMAQLGRTHHARLTILGDGSQRRALEQQAARLGIADRVSLPGYVDDVRPYLAQASVFLMTSRYEGYPAALVEAVGQGLPTVTTECSPAVAEIVRGSEAGRTAADNPRAMADALRMMLSRSERRTDPMIFARHDTLTAAAAYLDMLDRQRASSAKVPVRLVALR